MYIIICGRPSMLLFLSFLYCATIFFITCMDGTRQALSSFIGGRQCNRAWEQADRHATGTKQHAACSVKKASCMEGQDQGIDRHAAAANMPPTWQHAFWHFLQHTTTPCCCGCHSSLAVPPTHSGTFEDLTFPWACFRLAVQASSMPCTSSHAAPHTCMPALGRSISMKRHCTHHPMAVANCTHAWLAAAFLPLSQNWNPGNQ